MKYFVFIFGFFAFFSSLAYSDDDWDVKHSDKANATAEKMRTDIGKELIKIGNHPWAGIYLYGDGLGVNVSLLLAPKSGFLFEWHGCLGLYDRNYGSITQKDGHIHLSLTYKNEREGFQGIADDFIPVSWGERQYLIASDKMIDFCNDVNSGSESAPISHNHLLRVVDKEQKVTGLPVVPEEFRIYLLEKPIRAEITYVGKSKRTLINKTTTRRFTPIKINAGKKQNLIKGMELYVILPENVIESAKIINTDEDSSEAIIEHIDNHDPTPRIGWQLSTRCRWYDSKQ